MIYIFILFVKNLMLICRLNDCSPANELFSGHFILSVANENCLILRSIVSKEFLLPFPNMSKQAIKNVEQQIDDKLLHNLSKVCTQH